MFRVFNNVILTFTFFISISCSSYKSSLMFSAESSSGGDWHRREPFKIENSDELNIKVFPWKGEEWVTSSQNPETKKENLTVSISSAGYANLPLIGKTYLLGYSLSEADSILALSFSEYFKEPFVQTTFTNKRATVIGAEKTQVIGLNREDIRLSEVLAMSGGIPFESRARNVKVFRDGEFFIADLTRAETKLENDILIQSGDLIYIEPVRRSLRLGLRDAAPVISTITSLLTLAALLLTIL